MTTPHQGVSPAEEEKRPGRISRLWNMLWFSILAAYIVGIFGLFIGGYGLLGAFPAAFFSWLLFRNQLDDSTWKSIYGFFEWATEWAVGAWVSILPFILIFLVVRLFVYSIDRWGPAGIFVGFLGLYGVALFFKRDS